MNLPLHLAGGPPRRLLFGAALPDWRLAVRQYLFVRLANARLNRALLASLGSGGAPVVYPLPRVWQDVLRRHGFRVAVIRCTVAFAGYVLLLWVYGLILIARHGVHSVSRTARTRAEGARPYAYLAGLVPANLPRPAPDGRSHDVVSWYAQWKERIPDLACVRHNVAGVPASSVGETRVEFGGEPVPALPLGVNSLRFLAWSVAALAASAFDAVRGRWWHALLLAEATVAAKARLQQPGRLARDYLLPNSVSIYRPLWTYEAERQGCRILSYFYSTSEQHKLPAGYEPDRNEWGAMNWPLYLVWDQHQRDMLDRALGRSAPVKICGPIWFQSSPKPLPILPPTTIAVFDIQPPRLSAHFGFSTINDSYPDHPQVAVQFLADVDRVARSAGAKMAHKLKRHAGYQLHRKYEALVDHLTSNGMISIDPETAPSILIEQCAAVVSFPFTSTGVVAARMGKPSVFYDPLGVVQRDDRAAHGVPIVCGEAELAEWLAGVLDARKGSAVPGQGADAGRVEDCTSAPPG